MLFHSRFVFTFFALLISLPSSAIAAETHALIIGIDNYINVGKLGGAKNDANHIQQALIKSGVPNRNITKLLDQHASRQRITQSWKNMVQKSKPGDYLIFTFAGHGTFIDDLDGDEHITKAGDRSDETFLLSRFAWTGNGYNEQLVDDELGEWFDNAIKQGRKVLFVADACHSGGSYRSTNSEVGKSRFVSPPRGLKRKKPVKKSARKDLSFDSNFAFFSGSKSNQVVNEVAAPTPFIKNGPLQPRGPLSIAFAEALHEKLIAVDSNRDKSLSLDELRRHIRHRVASFSLKNQEPTFYPAQGSNVVLQLRPAHTPAIAAPTKNNVGIKVSGQPPSFLSFLSNITAKVKNYDLNWGVNNGLVFNKFGDLMARDIRNQNDIGRVATRYQLVKVIETLAIGHTIESQLGNTERRAHPIGTPLKFSINELKHKTLLQFNLTGNGEVQCFDSEHVNGSKSYDFTTSAPVGNDTLVTLAMDNPPSRLKQLVGSERQCTTDLNALVDELPKLLRGQRYQLSTIDIFVR